MLISRQLTEVVSVLVEKICTEKRKAKEKKMPFDLKVVKRLLTKDYLQRFCNPEPSSSGGSQFNNPPQVGHTATSSCMWVHKRSHSLCFLLNIPK